MQRQIVDQDHEDPLDQNSQSIQCRLYSQCCRCNQVDPSSPWSLLDLHDVTLHSHHNTVINTAHICARARIRKQKRNSKCCECDVRCGKRVRHQHNKEILRLEVTTFNRRTANIQKSCWDAFTMKSRFIDDSQQGNCWIHETTAAQVAKHQLFYMSS